MQNLESVHLMLSHTCVDFNPNKTESAMPMSDRVKKVTSKKKLSVISNFERMTLKVNETPTIETRCDEEHQSQTRNRVPTPRTT